MSSAISWGRWRLLGCGGCREGLRTMGELRQEGQDRRGPEEKRGDKGHPHIPGKGADCLLQGPAQSVSVWSWGPRGSLLRGCTPLKGCRRGGRVWQPEPRCRAAGLRSGLRGVAVRPQPVSCRGNLAKIRRPPAPRPAASSPECQLMASRAKSLVVLRC